MSKCAHMPSVMSFQKIQSMLDCGHVWNVAFWNAISEECAREGGISTLEIDNLSMHRVAKRVSRHLKSLFGGLNEMRIRKRNAVGSGPMAKTF